MHENGNWMNPDQRSATKAGLWNRMEELRERKRLLAQVVAQTQSRIHVMRQEVYREERNLRAAEAQYRTAVGELKAYQDSHPPMSSTAGGTYEEGT